MPQPPSRKTLPSEAVQYRGYPNLNAPSPDIEDLLVCLCEFLTDACRFYQAARTRFEPGSGPRCRSTVLAKMSERLRVLLPQVKELLRDQDHTNAHLSGLNLDTRRLAAIVGGVEQRVRGSCPIAQATLRACRPTTRPAS